MKTKVIIFNGLMAVIRWNKKPIAGDFMKAYVNYFYSDSCAEFDEDMNSKNFIALLDKVKKYCADEQVQLWSF